MFHGIGILCRALAVPVGFHSPKWVPVAMRKLVSAVVSAVARL